MVVSWAQIDNWIHYNYPINIIEWLSINMVMINKSVNVMSALFMICELYFRIKWKIKYTALSEQFQSLTIKKPQYK
jgi:hypothetical protein